MSRLWSERVQRFKQNRLGYFSLIVLGLIFFISMSAKWIANDKPLLVYYQQQYYLPILTSYPETTFGGVFETEADYKDPVVQRLIQTHGWMLWPMIRYAANTPNLDLQRSVPSPPSQDNWLGTDDQGRDVLARVLYGLRNALLFSFALSLASAVVGILVGAIQGYYAGWIDLIGQRILEIWSGLPMLFIVMILVSMFSPSIYWLFAIMLFFGWTSLVSLIRAEFLRSRHLDYVRAAKAIGVPNYLIIWRHILPNAITSSLSQLPFLLMANMTALTALDFLGYGLPPETASLGELLLQGKNNLTAPWLACAGFISLALVLALLICVGDAIRDATDPRQL
ncbi:ABC transporter permease [Acinetobacter sp. MD2]|uniref:ABC transporter permease n=1 Tax=Acinetobacter sp. MD2 TaxID=2600066 RepID=UPI002D1E6C57|nr:ABC transporter permease [Acinetobacter sp. MD2]MEB3767715.1 ABC transporter permease [Acinetobacter sp. MD2]